MYKLELDYATFSSITTNKKLWWQYLQLPERYFIYSVDQNLVYATEINTNSQTATEEDVANQLDFETNYKDVSNRPVNLSGTSTMSGFFGKSLEIAAENSSGSVQWQFLTDAYISKVLPMPVDAEWGDNIHFQVVAPDGTTVIVTYGQDIPLYGNQPNQWFYGCGAGKVPAGFIIRCIYDKVGSNARKFGITAEFLI